MKQIHVSKKRRPVRQRQEALEPLTLDARDPDIVRAKELTRKRAQEQARERRG